MNLIKIFFKNKRKCKCYLINFRNKDINIVYLFLNLFKEINNESLYFMYFLNLENH